MTTVRHIMRNGFRLKNWQRAHRHVRGITSLKRVQWCVGLLRAGVFSLFSRVGLVHVSCRGKVKAARANCRKFREPRKYESIENLRGIRDKASSCYLRLDSHLRALRVAESQSKPSYNPSPLVAQVAWMYLKHVSNTHHTTNQQISLPVSRA